MIVLVDLIGFGIVLPLLPFYGTRFGASPLAIGLLYSVYSFAQFIAAPLWGIWSDRVGRRPVMLLSMGAAVIAYLLFATAGSFGALFVSRLVAGVMGGNISAAQAYVADVTTEEERARGMGLIGAAFGIGFVLGPALAGVLMLERLPLPGLLAAHRLALPGLTAAALSFSSFLLILFRLPEPAKKTLTARSDRREIFTRRFWSGPLALFFAAAFLFSLGQSSLYGAFPLYCHSRIGMGPDGVGFLYVLMGVVTVIIQGGALRALVRRFGERRLFLAGAILLTAGLMMIGLTASARFLAAMLVMMTAGVSLSVPVLNSLVTKRAGGAGYGASLGAAQSLAALGRTVGPAWGGLLFGISAASPFWITAIVISATIWIGLRIQAD